MFGSKSQRTFMTLRQHSAWDLEDYIFFSIYSEYLECCIKETQIT